MAPEQRMAIWDSSSSGSGVHGSFHDLEEPWPDAQRAEKENRQLDNAMMSTHTQLIVACCASAPHGLQDLLETGWIFAAPISRLLDDPRTCPLRVTDFLWRRAQEYADISKCMGPILASKEARREKH